MDLMLNEFLIALLIVVIPLVAKYLIALFKSLTDGARAKEEESDIVISEKYLDMADEVVYSVVMFIAQTFVDTLKRDGAFNLEAQQIAFEDAKTKILILLSDPIKQTIEYVHGDLDSWINMKIEAAVKSQKLLEPGI